ncbi:flippase [Salmonella enterica]|nr:flippase [Salmonella enterica]EAU7889953.1 flippase [Salmonella enterica]EDE9522590.1 oligosaccharide flippase family protein [Salmonella enterica]EDU4939934.1 oligosaccharide flippase family protein [Salmonella enterica subsp. arizonae]EDX5082772.1 oligosaccharide flippase family protein [Salmonella enterica subsp. arizonae]
MLINKEYKNVIYNAGYLLCTQGVAYIAPIIVLGHLIATLGIDGFGKYAFALVLMAYFQVVIDYGFAFSSSRAISQSRDDVCQISRIYFSTSFIKAILALILLAIVYVICNVLVNDNTYSILILSAFLWAFANSMYPLWFFQGIEKLKIVAIVNIISRLLACILVLYFVRNESDTNFAILAQAFPVLLGAIYVNFLIFLKKYIKVNLPSTKFIFLSLRDGWDYFLATFASTLLTNSAVFILGIYYTPSVVGVYAIVERIVKAIVSLFSPLTQSLYPYNCRKFKESFGIGILTAIRTGRLLVILSLIVSVILLISWKFIYPRMDLPQVTLIYAFLLVPWLCLGVLNNVLGIQILSASGYAKMYSRSFICSAVLTVIFLLLLVGFFEGYGAAVAVSGGELLLCILLLNNIRKVKEKKLNKEF